MAHLPDHGANRGIGLEYWPSRQARGAAWLWRPAPPAIAELERPVGCAPGGGVELTSGEANSRPGGSGPSWLPIDGLIHKRPHRPSPHGNLRRTFDAGSLAAPSSR